MTQELITISPIDGREVVRRAYADDAQVARALEQARQVQRAWQALSIAERGRIVSAAVDSFVAAREEIARAITIQMGRPLRYTPGEVGGFESRARHMIAIAEQALAPIRVPEQSGFTRFISREPIGVALTIAPWNYPLLTAVNSIVPALMAGNTVILKHSDQTPLCAELIDRAFRDAGAPTGVFQYLHANHDTAQRLVRAPEIGYVSFTGSVRGGAASRRARPAGLSAWDSNWAVTTPLTCARTPSWITRWNPWWTARSSTRGNPAAAFSGSTWRGRGTTNLSSAPLR